MRKLILIVTAISLAVTTLAVVAAFTIKAGPLDRESRTYLAKLVGAQVVGPEVTDPSIGVVTDTQGFVRVTFDKTFSFARFKLKVDANSEILEAGLFCAAAGVVGPKVVQLFGPVASPGLNHPGGPLASGTIRNADIIFASGGGCPGIINNVASLEAQMRARNIYAAVMTNTNPGGEIRGQLRGFP